jgi:clan AA aspartic protease
MKGHVDRSGRALISIELFPTPDSVSSEVEAWIDTGFTGDLVLPQQQVETLRLEESGTVKAILADGSEVALMTYGCEIEWSGERRHLEVVANDGEFPLLGTGLLLGHELRINYRTGELTIE